MNLSLINAHPRDANIRFQEEGHKYTILTDLTSKYTSCTTWNHSHFAKFDADAVVAAMMRGKNWNPTNKYWGLTADQIKQQWAASGSAAAKAGTQMHYEIECFMGGQIPPSTQRRPPLLPNKYTHQDLLERWTIDDNASPEWKLFLNFVKDTPHLVPYRTEWLIYDEQAKISGSIDMVYENPDGSLMIYDWKRCAKIEKTNGFGKWAITECISHLPDSNFWHYALQLNTYKTIIERNYGKRVTDLCLVRLHPDSKKYELVKVPILEEEMRDLFNNNNL
jgi:ATP-dependent exoDNAse (exonuclease V) beta subunit